MAESETRRSKSLSKLCGVCGGRYLHDEVKCPTDGSELKEVGTDLIGTMFATKYEITSVLGEGGMSLVYKAQHKLMDRTVALKVLRKHLVEDTVAVERFKYESRAASSLDHPNIVAVHDFGFENGQAFFVMDCLEGPTLSDVITEKGSLSAEEAVPIFAGICRGLAHAHEKGVIHRDLKPSNIVLLPQKDGKTLVKIVDFGIAKVLPVEGKVRQQLTQTGEVFGSPLYMSPEQCLGKNPDPRSDIYSLGCLMYETLSGTPPLMGDTAFETMTKHVNQAPLAFSKLERSLNVPPDLEATVFKCLQKEPDHRFQSVNELLAALPNQNISSVRPVIHLAAPAKQINWWSSKPFLTVLALALSAVAAWAYYIAFSEQGPPTDRGTSLNKWIWNKYMESGEAALTHERFQDAAKAYGMAALQTENGHLTSQEKLLHALEGEKDAYGHLSDDAKVAEISKRIGDIKTRNALSNFKKLKKTLEMAKNGGTLNANLSDAVSNLSNVKECALNLQAYHLYDEEEQLLNLALDDNVYPRALGPAKTDNIAELWRMLGDCYRVQQKMADAVRCYNQSYKTYEKIDDDSLESITAELQLGEFYKDQNDFKESFKFLEPALRKARNNKEQPWGLKVYAHSLRAYGDYLYQQGHKEESAKDVAEAKTIEDNLRATGKDPEGVSLP